MYPLSRSQYPAPRLPYCFFAVVPPLTLHPVPSLISNCSESALWNSGKSRKLESVLHKKQGTLKGFCAQEPRRILLGFRSQVNYSVKVGKKGL